MSITGSPDGEPQKVGVALVDVLAGLFSTVGILAALEYRRQSREGPAGRGRPAVVAARGARQPGVGIHRRGRGPRANGQRASEHHAVRATAVRRRELVVAVGNDRQFGALCEVLGAPELARDPRFETTRRGSRIERRCGRRSRRGSPRARPREWAEVLTAARVPAGVVNDIGAAFELARSLGLEPVVEHRARGRHDDRAGPQPDPDVGDASELPLRAAPVPAAGSRRAVPDPAVHAIVRNLVRYHRLRPRRARVMPPSQGQASSSGGVTCHAQFAGSRCCRG